MGESRNEQFLEAWRDGATITIEPRSRNEKWLATIAGMTGVECDEPRSRIEYLLSQIAEAGGGGGGGGGALKMGALRPDAELVQSWTYDKLVVEDEGVTLPSWTSTATTLISGSSMSPSYELDMDTYDYLCVRRGVVNPILSSYEGVKVGYSFYDAIDEIVEIPAGSIVVNGTASTSRVFNIITGASRCSAYKDTNSHATISTSTSYGSYWNTTTPSISSNSLTVKTPNLMIKGDANVMTGDVWGRMTDVRAQYICELYRVKKGAANIDGWGLKSQAMHIIGCAQSGSGKLT